MAYNKIYMDMAIKLAVNNVKNETGGPFGAIIVKDGKIIGKGANSVTTINDPTAHAEIVAIRDACKNLDDFQLTDCEIYSSCEPCPMCLGAIYWARPKALYFACGKDDASDVGFDDSFIYKEIKLDYMDRQLETQQHHREQGLAAFKAWENSLDKKEY